jgi:hypothetical protein
MPPTGVLLGVAVAVKVGVGVAVWVGVVVGVDVRVAVVTTRHALALLGQALLAGVSTGKHPGGGVGFGQQAPTVAQMPQGTSSSPLHGGSVGAGPLGVGVGTTLQALVGSAAHVVPSRSPPWKHAGGGVGFGQQPPLDAHR